MNRLHRTLFVALFLCALSACGGGDVDDDTCKAEFVGPVSEQHPGPC